MSFQLEYRWEGIEQLKKALDRAPSKLREIMHKKMDEKSKDAVFFAKHYVPVKTGYLRNSIYYRSVGFLEFLIEAYANYAGFVEYGTSKQRAQPYMRPSLELVTLTLKNELLQEILEYFAKETGRIG